MTYMKIINKYTLLLVCFLLSFAANAQTDAVSADVMRSNGKIYVVVAVLVTILGGMIAYLISTDSKLKKLEKEVENR